MKLVFTLAEVTEILRQKYGAGPDATIIISRPRKGSKAESAAPVSTRFAPRVQEFVDKIASNLFPAEKIHNIKSVRQFYTDYYKATLNLLPAKVMVENWLNVRDFYFRNGVLPTVSQLNGLSEVGLGLITFLKS